MQELAFLNRGRADHLRATTAPAKARRSSTSDGILRVRRVSQPGQRAGPRRTSSTSTARAKASAVEVALQYSTEYTENVHSYVNNINTTEGGTHLSGFRTALTRTLNNYGKKAGIFKDLVPTRRRLPRRPHRRDHVAACPIRSSKARPRPSSATARSRASSTRLVGEFLGQVPGREPQDRQGHRATRACWRPRPARPPARPEGADPRAQGRPLRRRPARQAPRLLQPRRRQVRAVPGRRRFGRRQRRGRPASASSRPSSPCAARSSTPTSRAKTRCSPTRKSAA